MLRLVFDPRPFHVEFVVDKGAMGQVFLRVLELSLLSIIALNFNNFITDAINPSKPRASLNTH
jgi:hypothetical protein